MTTHMGRLDVPVLRHSSEPAASTRHRIRPSAPVAGFSATVSALALIIRLPMEAFLTQCVINPQPKYLLRLDSRPTTFRTLWVGGDVVRGPKGQPVPVVLEASCKLCNSSRSKMQLTSHFSHSSAPAKILHSGIRVGERPPSQRRFITPSQTASPRALAGLPNCSWSRSRQLS